MEQQNQQYIQEKTETKPPMKTNWKFVVIVVVLGMLVGGGVVWYTNLLIPEPQPVEISNIKKPTPQQAVDISTWQTYRNEEFGFEVKYPPTWLFNPSVEYGEIPSLDIHISNFGADDAPDCELGYIGLEMQIGGGKKYGRKGEDFETFVRSYVQTERELGMPSGKIEKIQTTNYVGFRIEDSGWDSSCKGPGYLIDQGQQRYIYVFTGRQDVKNQIYIDQILATFRFVESSKP